MHFIPLCWQFLPIMLALCSMLLPPYYVQNYAGIIGSSLIGTDIAISVLSGIGKKTY